ncbi:outer membrane protein assembly factor BamE [Piscinibacter koreensis]|uniref:Outer membrane protein assembly factor BamE n=1 Tax=Piscinibacter koreensis TaxID=2742824 RepID=A0A7Y6TV03_9BURK|nr:outer membrane protein assembly factor BamE [Schlegelella koreensis]NUZ04579.1 outer membrane protein assembly factor BamE [Schlegelella koreensis]
MPSRPVPFFRGVAAAAMLALLALGGCQSLQSSDNFLGVITPYRLEVVQGNVITREMAQAVKPGMTRAEVRDVLGSPLLTDVFHANRWDYVFTIRRQGAEPQLRRVVALFENDRLASIDSGGELPAEREFVASIDTFKTARNAPPLELTEAQLKALPPPAAAPSASAPASAPARSYPPLESRP